MSSDILPSLSQNLYVCLQGIYWSWSSFSELKHEVEGLSHSLSGYTEYLEDKSKRVKARHLSETPVRELSDPMSWKFLPPVALVPESLKHITKALKSEAPYEPVALDQLCPSDPRQKYRFIKKLEEGLSMPTVLFSVAPGNNVWNLHFMWRARDGEAESGVYKNSLPVVERLKPQLPIYHTRAMRKALFEKFGRISPQVKPTVLRSFYRDLTGDQSAGSNAHEKEIDQHSVGLAWTELSKRENKIRSVLARMWEVPTGPYSCRWQTPLGCT